MKFAICSEILKELPWGDACTFAKKTGYEGIEIAPFVFASSVTLVDRKRRREIRQAAADAGMEIVGLHWLLVGPEGIHVNHPDSTTRKKTMEYLKELIGFCADVGGSLMVLGSPKQRNVIQGMNYQQAWDATAETLQVVAPEALRSGVTICLEALSTEETNFLNTASEAVKLASQLNHPNIKVLLDVKAMCAEKLTIPEIIKSTGKWLHHFHANDANRKGPGFGEVDFKPIFAALREIGYDGYVSVEVFQFEEGYEVIASRSLEYMKSTCT